MKRESSISSTKKGTIIFDLDGTAIDSPQQKLPTSRLVKAVAGLQAQYYVCAATGRAYSFAKDVIAALKLDDLCIIAGGTSIVDPAKKEIVWRQAMHQKAIRAALPIIQRSGCRVLFDDYTEQDYLGGGWAPSRLDGVTEAYFLEIVFMPPEQAKAAAKELSKIKGIHAMAIDAQRPGVCDIHITHKQATKEHAIAELIKRLGADPAKSIGVGDGHNDLHLFSGVHHKVAMGNAVDELKQVADEIIGTVDKDGLATYFEGLKQPKFSR